MNATLRTRLKKMESKHKPQRRPHVIVCAIGQSQQEAIAAYHTTHPDFNPHDEDNILFIVRDVVG